MSGELIGKSAREDAAMSDYNGYRVEVQVEGQTIISEARFGDVSDGATLLAQHLLTLYHGLGSERLGALGEGSWASITATVRPAVVDLVFDDELDDGDE